MYKTEHENGVLICSIHRTPISKSHGRFFCVKCQRNAGAPKVQQITAESNPEIWAILQPPKKCPDSCCYGSSRKNCTLGKETASECNSPS